MPSTVEVAVDHAARRRRVVASVSRQTARMWSSVDQGDIRRSWSESVGRVLIMLVAAQRHVAARSDDYLDAVLDAQDLDTDRRGSVNDRAFAGVASDGRPLLSLLEYPVLAALRSIKAGAGPVRGLAGGGALLDMIVRTQVADAGRLADQVGMAARPAVSGYVRLLVGRTCARCALLAGRRYSWRADFQRHPRCDCIAVPARSESADEVMTDPRQYFQSLTVEDQDRLFTRDGAEAIRQGADIGKVINARRGMYSASGRTFTRAGKLTPEQIFREANGNRTESVRLLRRFGYLT